jgi:SAM-dependent methyltransferase
MTHAAERFAGLDLEHYDAILGPAQLEPIASELSTRLAPDPGGDVLELACGTGILTRQLRRRLHGARRVVATDLSPAMVEFAQHKLGSRASSGARPTSRRCPLPKHRSLRCCARSASCSCRRRT